MTTMNNEDPAKCLHPQIIAFAVADEGPDHGKPSGLWACAECGRKFEPADHMREAIAAERERDYLRWRMREIIPLFEEARDALCAISLVAATAYRVDLSLGSRMDAAGTRTWEEFEAAKEKK